MAAAKTRKPQHRSKEWGREVENQTKKALAPYWPEVTRTGSLAYTKAASDLKADGTGMDATLRPVCLVVTKDKGTGNPLLVTLAMDDLQYLMDRRPDTDGIPPLRVQCKGRASTWIGKLWRELQIAVKAEKGAGQG